MRNVDESVRDSEHRPRSEKRPTLERRKFLQVGLMGAAASAVGTASARAAADADSSCRACDPPGPPPPPSAFTPRTPQPLKLAGAFENWNEPWVWRPSDWPGQQLDLNVVENQNPGIEVGLGNAGSVIFSYGGNTPGPTIRMRGDETLNVKLRNLFGEDCGVTYVGPFPDLNELVGEVTVDDAQKAARALGNERFDFCIGEMVNGVHSVRVTNLHTHGLHVRPDKNPDGTHSDNVILRVISQDDFKRRERETFRDQDVDAEACECGGTESVEPACKDRNERIGDSPENAACAFLRDPRQVYFVTEDEVVGESVYEFRLGDNRVPDCDGRLPVEGEAHPPGTHWYHPHAHGATAMQVSSGMAGFLIVEGDVDDAINCVMTGTRSPNPTAKTGKYDYRERLMFMQRAFLPSRSRDPDSPNSQLHQVPILQVNGSDDAGIINMRRGAIERWRVINGSVDGRGFKRFMVLAGQYQLVTLATSDSGGEPRVGLRKLVDGKLVEVDLETIESDKRDLYQLSIDGVTLVTPDGDYTLKDLSRQNPDARKHDPLTADPPPAVRELIDKKYRTPEKRRAAVKLWRIENAFKDGRNIKNAFVRPNEYYMGPANRTDVFFQLPCDAEKGDVFTVFARGVSLHSDTPPQTLQEILEGEAVVPPVTDIIVGYVVVNEEDPVEGAAGRATRVQSKSLFDEVMERVRSCLPPAPRYLQPVADCELAAGLPPGEHRTRTIEYSGWGSDGYPLVTTAPSNPSSEAFRKFLASDKARKLKNLYYGECEVTNGEGKKENVTVLMPPSIRTMAIDGRKFRFDDPERPRVLVDTAEEWALYNHSQTLWADTGHCEHQVGQYNDHYIAYPCTLRQGMDRFWENGAFRIVTRAIDHPFHIHQNPFWVSRIEIPDENGELHNILDEPRWMDTIWIPRNRGRVVFRSRFPDYVGTYVHHCHILLHEDNGMMQPVQATPFPDEANFVERRRVSRPGMRPEEVSAIYPRKSPDAAYGVNTRFVDTNPLSAQEYPGFKVSPPSWPPPGMEDPRKTE